MKQGVAISLIFGAVFLIALPPVSDLVRAVLLTRILDHGGVTNANLQGEMGDLYRFSCWLIGALMIVTAVVGSIAVPAREVRDGRGNSQNPDQDD